MPGKGLHIWHIFFYIYNDTRALLGSNPPNGKRFM